MQSRRLMQNIARQKKSNAYPSQKIKAVSLHICEKINKKRKKLLAF
jgi:hypothetical protein